jgi:hypothetical protein
MVESPEYDVLRTVGNVEIRHYQTIIVATVEGMTEGDAFGILFRYIDGNNRSRSKIPMTAPVINAERYFEKIPMTAPVISDRGTMSFIMPAGYTIDTIPAPMDERVITTEVKGRTLAVLRFRGHASKKVVKEKVEVLLDTIGEEGISTRGEPFLMRYNPPFTPGFLRRNEIAVEVSL